MGAVVYCNYSYSCLWCVSGQWELFFFKVLVFMNMRLMRELPIMIPWDSRNELCLS